VITGGWDGVSLDDIPALLGTAVGVGLAMRYLPKLFKKGSLKVDSGHFSKSEIRAAYYMKNLGKKVHLRQPKGTRKEGGTSDLLVDGVRYDVYTPITGNHSRIISGMAKKNKQTEGIVLDLSQTSVTREELGNMLKRTHGMGGTNIIDIIVLGE